MSTTATPVNEDRMSVLTLKAEFDNCYFSDMDRVYYRSINNIAPDTVVLVMKSDGKTVKTIWWE